MELNTTSNRMSSLLVLYDMQTTYFINALEGISDKDAQVRLNTKANHVAWLSGSLVQERYELAGALSKPNKSLKQKAHELFSDHKGIQDGITYPSLAEFKKDWKTISPVLRKAMVNASDAQLDGPFEMPGESMTLFDLIAFITYREANCIGQIALWRRLLGYDAMKYM